MLAVTSFHPEGHRLYGKRCLEGLVACWPGRIVCYYEELPDFRHEKIEYRSLFDIPGFNAYIEKLKRHPGTDGKGSGKYDFRYNANAFCRKVFAQDAVFDEDDFVYWIDADCIIKKNIPEELPKLLLEGVPFCYLGRSGESSYTETGVVGFSTKHPDFAKFRAQYLPYFTSGRIFSQLKGWHDCIAFDHARQGIKGNNLTPRGMAMASVIQDSALGKYIAHLKGPRKFSDKHIRDALAV